MTGLPPVATEQAFAARRRAEAQAEQRGLGLAEEWAAQIFAAAGDTRFLGRTLTAYGYHPDDLGSDLRRRPLAWGLAHRDSSLNWWLNLLPAPAEPTLTAMADRWFATGCGGRAPFVAH